MNGLHQSPNSLQKRIQPYWGFLWNQRQSLLTALIFALLLFEISQRPSHQRNVTPSITSIESSLSSSKSIDEYSHSCSSVQVQKEEEELALLATRSSNVQKKKQRSKMLVSILQDPLILVDIGALFLLGGSSAHGWKWLLKLVPITRLASKQSASKLLVPLWRRAVKHSTTPLRSLGRAIKNIYKNRSKYSGLSDYTWYVGVGDSSKVLADDSSSDNDNDNDPQ